MSRKQKKRNKPYRGADAAEQQPVVRHYSAKVRSPLSEWWQEKKRAVKLVSLVGGGAVLFGYFIFEFLRLIF